MKIDEMINGGIQQLNHFNHSFIDISKIHPTIGKFYLLLINQHAFLLQQKLTNSKILMI